MPNLTAQSHGTSYFTEPDARYGAAHVVALYPRDLTPARFRATTLPFLVGLDAEQAATARLRIFLGLPCELQRAFYRALADELDADFIRVGCETYVWRSADRALEWLPNTIGPAA